MFGSNNKGLITSEQMEEMLAPFKERIELLEKEVRKQACRVEMLEQRIEGFTAVAAVPSDDIANEMAEQQSVSVSPEPPSQTCYLPAPTPDGIFLESSSVAQVGKSIYRLHTEDGANGRFVMLSTADAIATATISVSQFVKPVCRIEGNIHQLPRQIETVEEGMAQKDGAGWKVVRKAKVVFLP